MSIRQIRMLLVSSLLVVSISSLPVAAAPRDGGGRDRDNPVIRFVRQVIKKLISIPLDDTMSIPHP